MIHAYASRAHYWDHLRPIWESLPEYGRGTVFSPTATQPWGQERPPRAIPGDDLVLVASYVDSRKRGRSRVVYVEHGAGQTYRGDPRGWGHGSYAGGDGHDHVRLFLSPREEIAQLWRDAYWRTPAVAVGCPKLDRYAGLPRVHDGDQTVAFSFHWENPLCNESRSALPHYRRDLPAVVAELRKRGWRILGHGHPREMGALARLWRALDVPVVEDQEYVFAHASVFVCDNSSAMYEAAAIGIPVVVLDAPWYRADVHHGLRFWDVIPGPQVNNAGELIDTIERAQMRLPFDVASRDLAVAKTYAAVDGHASERAVAAILEVLKDG